MKLELDQWLTHFRRPAEDRIDWTLPAALNGAERAAISRSIAAFQLGEYSEGRGLMKHARAWAAANADGRLVEITQSFIREEQHHAALLKRFMREADIPLVSHHWTDTVFRGIRRSAGYEWSITVLITAEIIALTYYEALSLATGNQLLRQICRKLLQDERAHVSYEATLLNEIRKGHGPTRNLLIRAGHWLLFHGTLLVVLIDHYPVIARGGGSSFTFFQACRKTFRDAFEVHQRMAWR